MRISTNQRYDSYTHSVGAAERRLFEAQQLMTTGKRLNAPSDDPVATAGSIRTRSIRSALGQYDQNLMGAKSSLSFSEQALEETSTLMQRAYTLALAGATASTDQTARATMATEVDELQKRLVDLANSRGPNGEFLFAGQANDKQAFTRTGSTLTYNGDGNSILAEVGPGQTLASNTPGGALFKQAFDTLQTLRDALQGGSQQSIADISVPNAQEAQKQIDLTRGAIGARLRRVDDLLSQNGRRSDELSAHLSDLEEVDLSEAVTQYKQAESAYQAALTVAAKGFELSLMDYIR